MASPLILPPEAAARFNDIAKNDELKGAVVHTFDPDATPQQKAAAVVAKSSDKPKSTIDSASAAKELPVDTGTAGIALGNTVQDVAAKQLSQKLSTTEYPSLPGSLTSSAKDIPDWYIVGWRAVSGIDAPPPDGPEKDVSVLNIFLKEQFYGQWFHNAAIIFFAVFSSHFLTRFNLGWGWLIIVLAICNTYYVTSVARVRTRARDDIQRELVKSGITATEHERAEWLNEFLACFWRIYEPVLSATIVSSVDQILSTTCPPFLESLRLTTFTLGNKSVRIDHVRTLPNENKEEDTVAMEWAVSFTPTDLSDLSPTQARLRVNPKIVLSIRLGKGFASAAIPVLLEDLTFSGRMRIEMKLMANFPHVQLVDISFLEKPKFDYSLKPIGGETFGIDVANIPGLSNFIQDMVHATLSPMMYHPNVFTLNLEQLLSGTPLDTAIGVLQVFVHSARGIKGTKIGGGIPDPYVSLSINNRAELARTKYIHDTYNPTWMETKFLLVNSLTESIVLSLYDYNDHRANALLGSASFDLAQLREDPSREGISSPVLKDGKQRGEVRFDVTFYPVLENNPGDIQELPKTNVGIVRLVVHQAKELDSTKSSSGSLSPFATVHLGDSASPTHKSGRVKHTINPVWDSAAEFLCVDRKSSVITIKVTDDKLLGYVSVPLENLLDARGQSGKDWWPLSSCKTGRIRLSAEWKPLDMAGSLSGVDQHMPAIGVVRLLLLKATDVKNVEAALGGKSDPYVRVQINNFTLGRTEVINNNLNPVWDQIIYVPVHTLKEILFLECMDYQHLTKDRSLGSVELRLSELCSHQEATDYPYKSTGKKIGVDPIQLDKKNIFKGHLHYEAEFIPALALKGVNFEPSGTKVQQTIGHSLFDPGSEGRDDGSSISSSDIELPAVPPGITVTTPLGTSKKGYYEKGEFMDTNANNHTGNGVDNGVTGDDGSPPSSISTASIVSAQEVTNKEESKGVDMSKKEILRQQSGIIAINIIGAKLSRKARIDVLLDDGYWPAFSTPMARSTNMAWEYIGEGFIRELDWGRVWLRLNIASDEDKDDIIGELKVDTKHFLEQALDGPSWYTLVDHDGRSVGTVQLEARYIPVPVKLEPRESINNQGILHVKLIDGRDITGVDRSGKSDPFAVFSLNGQRVFKSHTKKQTLTPEWNEDFPVSVQSRVGADFEVEVFDWNQLEQAKSLGKARIDLTEVEPFQGIERTIHLQSEKHGEKGQVRLNLSFIPEMIMKSRKNTSTFSAAGRAMTQIGSLPVGAGKGVFHGVTGVFRKKNSSQEDLFAAIPEVHSGETSQPVVANIVGNEVPTSTSAQALPVQTALQNGRAGTLEVSVVDARGFNPTGEAIKPYIVVRCGDKEHKTKHASRTSAPECSWNESFFFVAGPATQQKVHLWIFEHKTLTKDKQLGVGEIDIWNHINPIGPHSADVTVELGQGQGELRVRLSYDAHNHSLVRKASNTSIADRMATSPSRFSIRSRRPGTVGDD